MSVNAMPTDREGLVMWLCESPDNVSEYLQAHGGRFLTFAKARTAQVFGVSNDILGTDLGYAALEVLYEWAESTRLLEIKVPVEHWLNGVVKLMVKSAFYKRAQGNTFVAIDDPAIQEELGDASYVLPADSADLRRLATAVEDCLKKLTPRQQEIMTMRLNDLDHIPENGDIATILGTSSGTVAVHLSEARKSMQDCLQKKGLP